MRTGLSLQWKGSGRGTPLLQAPNHKLSLLSKLILAPAIWSYLATAFFTTFMSRWRDTKTLISSAYADSFAERGSAKRMPHRAGLAFSSLSLRSRNSKVRTYRRGDRGQPCQTDCSITKAHECFPFTCTSACGLEYMLIHLRNSSFQNSRQKLMVNPIEGLNWSSLLQCHLLSPLGPRVPNASCLWSIFSSQRSSAQVQPDR